MTWRNIAAALLGAISAFSVVYAAYEGVSFSYIGAASALAGIGIACIYKVRRKETILDASSEVENKPLIFERGNPRRFESPLGASTLGDAPIEQPAFLSGRQEFVADDSALDTPAPRAGTPRGNRSGRRRRTGQAHPLGERVN